LDTGLNLISTSVFLPGRYFYFEVNKVPIYSKGSNLIPVDVLPERSNNESTIRDLLVSTKEANMNMLRVWGGGVYMSDYFYEVSSGTSTNRRSA
jgi:Beta-galactosidase/beta-glucuronidase